MSGNAQVEDEQRASQPFSNIAEEITEAPAAKEASAAASENSHELSQTDAASDAASASGEAALMARVELLELRCKVFERELSTRPGPVVGGAPSPITHAVQPSSNGSGLVYVGMSADLMHCGHANILGIARSLGRVVVGLLTDEAIASYKRTTIVKWRDRSALVQAFKGVELVVPQNTLDYCPNLEWLKPAFVVHGNDWSSPTSAQYKTRNEVRACLAQWGGILIEPPYTDGISTTDIIERAHNAETMKDLEAKSSANAKAEAES